MQGYGRSRYRTALGRTWGHWFAGFTDGEGAFMLISQQNLNRPHYTRPTLGARFMLSQRADDKTVLDEIRDKLGFGCVMYHNDNPKRPGEKPAYRFQVHRKEDCQKLVKIFRQYPLHSRKARQFELWAKAVEAMKWAKGSHTQERYDYVAALVSQLRQLREWNPGP